MGEAFRHKVLAVDDSPLVIALLTRALSAQVSLDTVRSGEEALGPLGANEYDLCLVDLLLPGMSGLDLIGHIKRLQPEAQIIVISQTDDIDTVIAAMKSQVFDFLRKPLTANVVVRCVERALEYGHLRRRVTTLTRELSDTSSSGELFFGPSLAMRKVWTAAKQYAEASDKDTILITGESGTGKELVARAIHRWSSRSKNPFIGVNCSLLEGSMASSELFGVANRVATGVEGHAGKFEAASSGTLFLDEIGDLPLESQSKVLRVLQEGVVTRVGAHREIPLDLRVIAATNRNLETAVERNEFRSDLYYRLLVLPIRIPPLRDRKDDLSGLITHLCSKHAKRIPASAARVLDPEIFSSLCAYSWPGNVRQLENTIIRLLITGELDISADRLPRLQPLPAEHSISLLGKSWTELEIEIMECCLRHFKGNVNQAAEALGISKSSIYDKIKKYDLKRPALGNE